MFHYIVFCNTIMYEFLKAQSKYLYRGTHVSGVCPHLALVRSYAVIGDRYKCN